MSTDGTADGSTDISLSDGSDGRYRRLGAYAARFGDGKWSSTSEGLASLVVHEFKRRQNVGRR
jgi:hypothetical protein